MDKMRTRISSARLVEKDDNRMGTGAQTVFC
jgi:hypothetical protein